MGIPGSGASIDPPVSRHSGDATRHISSTERLPSDPGDHEGHGHVHGLIEGRRPVHRLAITLLMLRITFQAWRTMRGAET
ncbi:MAG: hypothetical protein U0V73_05860 [Acidimicrobiia bacterium]